MQDLQWFLDREMSSVLRTEPREDTGDWKLQDQRTIEIYITNEKTAKYQHSLQKKGYTFAPKLVIHKAAPSSCASCEG